MERDLRRRRWPIAMLLTCIVAAIFAPRAGVASNAMGPVNAVLVLMTRRDDPDRTEPFAIEVGVFLEGVAGVTDVTVTSGGGVNVPMQGEGGGSWYGHLYPPDLAGLKLAVHGTWQIAIDGSSPSTSTFTMNGNVLQESDFFATPTGVFPTHGSVGVFADVIFSWNDPTGAETADVLFVVVETDFSGTSQGDDSLIGTMNITDTSWDPPLDLDTDHTFFVGYVNLDAAGLVGPLNVLSGSITWGNIPEAPPWYPASTPLLVLGSDTFSRFAVVAAPCPTDTNIDGFVNVDDLISLLGGWGPNPGHVADFDGNGTVNVDDLITLLAAWGACP